MSPNALARSERARAREWLVDFKNRLSGLLGCEEVDGDPRLKIICGCLLFYYHMTFNYWRQLAVPLSTAGNELFDYVPAPLAEHFRWLIFADYFQTQTYLYGLGMLALLGLFSLFYLRSSLLALSLLAWLFINKFFFYLADLRLFTNYHHFHLLYSLVFLVSRDKLRFFRAALVVSYFASGVVKLSPSWLMGEYFNALPGKLPLLPKVDWVVTAASVGVVVLEFLGPLCWFTRIKWLRRISFGGFILFHIYSGVIVGYWYTSLMLPVVVAVFMRFDEPLQSGYRFLRRDLVVSSVLAVALAGSVYHYFIPGNVRLTGEGRYFGQFMFDANHSIQSEAKIRKNDKLWVIKMDRNWRSAEGVKGPDSFIRCDYFEDDMLKQRYYVTSPIRDGDEVIFNPSFFTSARMRISGDPYLYYYYARELMRRYQPDQISIRLDQRLNDHREAVTLLDIPDFAELDPTYKNFSHNEWILLPKPDSLPQYRWP